jgi:type IV pilus assembly protein PilB
LLGLARSVAAVAGRHEGKGWRRGRLEQVRMSVRLGEILVKESLITQDQLHKALEYQRVNGGKLGSCLAKMGFITDDDITGVLSRQYGVPSINLKYYEIDPNVIRLIPLVRS